VIIPRVLALFVATALLSSAAVTVPPAAVDEPLAATPGKATAVVAGGCFWGVQLVFQHVRGVTHVTSGYAGKEGEADPAESVEVVYDPSTITYGQLLQVFFAVAHDPTQLNRQGPDTGREYRSAIFTASPSQARIARAYVDQLNRANTFGKPIVTDVAALPRFRPAEEAHQNYATKHPDDPYIRINDAPKLGKFKTILPGLYKD
jgi:peptide-methionine (S)-S-oxide reductase